ncbi:hypothetical protein ABEB36_004961 [Hypothenemus hampei]|uniref:NADH dehydrogenase [ubiquinone] 1 beta subcomplex subunit 7 n=1 Tax=Hypothenemus hampei TaxID=57062 RepID=A0ABD1EWW5_HYPHA
MGNSFGYAFENGINRYLHPEITPSPDEHPTFDPLLGFPEGRKERVMLATKEEMVSCKIPLVNRDYCAHKLIEYLGCRKDNFPFVVKCAHEKHAYLNCRYDDFVTRMKEYERERRLRVKRQDKLKQPNCQPIAA